MKAFSAWVCIGVVLIFSELGYAATPAKPAAKPTDKLKPTLKGKPKQAVKPVEKKISAGNYEIDTKDLLLVEVVHRHGERTAVFDIPVAGRESAPVVPLEAQLTSEGVREMYDYGRYMRQRYRPFFEDNSLQSSQRIKVISSSTDRTIESAQSLIAGLLPPEGTIRQWNSTLGAYWKPFPVYTQPSRHDSLLLEFGDDCPVYSKLRDTIVDLPIAKQLEEEMKSEIDAVKSATGLKDYNFFETSTSLEDALHYQMSYPTPGGWPTWANTTVYKWFKRIADIRMQMMTGGNGDRQRTRLRSGVLLWTIFNNMDNSIKEAKNKKTSMKKMNLYSGHDENVGGILAALNLYNYTLKGPNFGIPEFTASIIFELYKNSTVRILLKNNPQNELAEPKVLVHPQCTSLCPLAKLRKLLEDVIIPDQKWQEECGLIPAGRTKRSAMSNKFYNMEFVRMHNWS